MPFETSSTGHAKVPLGAATRGLHLRTATAPPANEFLHAILGPVTPRLRKMEAVLVSGQLKAAHFEPKMGASSYRQDVVAVEANVSLLKQTQGYRGSFSSLPGGPKAADCEARIARMRFRSEFRVLTSWVAVLAILMAALAPSISHALGAKSDASSIEVCTSMGAKWIQADAASTDQAPASSDAHPFEHCPYCSLHANAVAIPVAPLAGMLAPALPHPLPTAFLAAPRTLYAWLSAQSRAPPSFS